MRDGSGFIEEPMRPSAARDLRDHNAVSDAARGERIKRQNYAAWAETNRVMKAQEAARGPAWWETGKYNKALVIATQANRDAVVADPYMTAAQLDADPMRAMDRVAELTAAGQPARVEPRMTPVYRESRGVNENTPLREFSADPITALQQVHDVLRSLGSRLEPFLRKGRRKQEAIPAPQSQNGALIDFATSSPVTDREQAVAQSDPAMDNVMSRLQGREFDQAQAVATQPTETPLPAAVAEQADSLAEAAA